MRIQAGKIAPVLLIMALLLLGTNVPGATASAPACDYRNSKKLTVGSVTIAFYYGQPEIFTESESQAFPNPTYRPAYEIKVATRAVMVEQRFVKVGEKTVEIRYASSEPRVAEVEPNGTIRPNRVSGTTTVLVSMDGKPSLNIPIRVTALPVFLLQARDAVIKAVGIPDRIDKIDVPWPSKVTKNCIIHSASGHPYGVTFEHWTYRKYPGAVLVFDLIGQLQAVYTQTWGIREHPD